VSWREARRVIREVEEEYGGRGRKPRRRRPTLARTPQWDNIRFVAGSLVVFVDMASTLTALDGVRWLHIATWALRVPAFALIAGYFSNAGSLRPRSVRPLFLTIVVPFLAVGLLHTLERRWATGEWRLFVEDPAWAMWFLLSLLCWRLALPYLARLRHPLAWSATAALAVGYLPADIGGTLELSRTLAFLPFFLLGWRLREGMLARGCAPGPGGARAPPWPCWPPRSPPGGCCVTRCGSAGWR
jgi:fucose 4-O-acetylase-like acetyltransferase